MSEDINENKDEFPFLPKRPDFVKTAVIGHPIAHSKSPLIHNTWLQEYGLKGSYEAIDVPPEMLGSEVGRLIEQGYSGFNVTLPHKIEIMPYCEGLDTKAMVIGAVNTVTILGGKLYGSNTDAFGFSQNILEVCQYQNWNDWSFAGGRAVVLGAGGAARAVVYALQEHGVPSIVVLNRTQEKAQELAQQMNTVTAPDQITVLPWEERSNALADANLIVNTTSLGMTGRPPLDIDLSLAPISAIVTDIVYAPLFTDLLKQAQQRGLRYVTGIGMLLHQARPGFEIWNGVMPDVTQELAEKVLMA